MKKKVVASADTLPARSARASAKIVETKTTPGVTTHEVMAPTIKGKSREYAVARLELEPGMRHGHLAIVASADLFKGGRGTISDNAEALNDIGNEVAGGDLGSLSRTMTAQAISLDLVYTQMTRRALLNLDQYPDAADRFMRLALKAQSQSRATVEALAKMHQPREQTVHHRHYHIGQDGKVVFVEHAHGGYGNGNSDGLPHATGAIGASAALLGSDT